MTAPAMEFSADQIAELVAVASQPGCRRWPEMVRSTGGCVCRYGPRFGLDIPHVAHTSGSSVCPKQPRAHQRVLRRRDGDVATTRSTPALPNQRETRRRQVSSVSTPDL